MKRIYKALSLFVITAFVMAAQFAQAANDKAMFWELKSDKATVYMFGSIHLADPSFYPLRKEVESAFAESGTLAVEADILNADQMQAMQLMFRLGMYPQGESLKDHVSEATMKDLQQALADNQLPMPIDRVSSMRPGTLMVMLGNVLAMQSGLNPELGIDLHFLKQATEQNKTIVELEGTEQLMKVMASLGPAEAVVRATIDQLNEYEELINEMVEVWKAGDDEAMARESIDKPLKKDPEMQEMMEIFLFERNRKMADKIKGFIKQEGTYFVVVGAAHLVGDKGVPELLKKAGYTVTRR